MAFPICTGENSKVEVHKGLEFECPENGLLIAAVEVVMQVNQGLLWMVIDCLILDFAESPWPRCF